MLVSFTRLDESDWPANHVWEEIRSSGLIREWIDRVRSTLKEGREPAGRTLVLYAQYVIDENRVSWKWLRQSWLNPTLWKIRGLLRGVEQSAWMETHHLASLMEVLNNNSYPGMVVGCWRRMQAKGLGTDTEAWAQTGNAFVNRGKKRAARALLADWRTRKGIRMWMLANYVVASSRWSRENCREVALTCEEALEKLPHDHCARYLAYMGAEARILTRDTVELLALWEGYGAYFKGAARKGDYFPKWQAYLEDDVPSAIRLLSESNGAAFGRLRWKLWIKRLWNPSTRRTVRQLLVTLLRLVLIGLASGRALFDIIR